MWSVKSGEHYPSTFPFMETAWCRRAYFFFKYY